MVVRELRLGKEEGRLERRLGAARMWMKMRMGGGGWRVESVDGMGWDWMGLDRDRESKMAKWSM